LNELLIHAPAITLHTLTKVSTVADLAEIDPESVSTPDTCAIVTAVQATVDHSPEQVPVVSTVVLILL